MEDGYVWINDYTKQFMGQDYLKPGQTIDQRVTEIVENAERILNKPGFAAKFKSYIQRGWYSLSTPVWTNYGTERGLPISCFGSQIGDSMADILFAHAEVGMMSKYGGGTSGGFMELRGRGSEIKDSGVSFGSAHFAQLFETVTQIVSQGSTRRGSIAGYQRVDHMDVREWLELRTEGNPIQDMSYGIVFPDYWMQEMIAGDAEKRELWALIIKARCDTGFPFLMFEGNANKNTVDVYKNKNMKINHTNLCTEIFLPNNEDESFVCCLSSMNVSRYNEWKDTDAVEVLVYFLDTVMSEFVEKTGSKIKNKKERYFISRAHNFAKNHRAIGIGWIGWHTLLQSKMIPWESDEASILNMEVAKTIKDHAYAASRKMAQEYGEPELLKGYGRRHATLLAIAPTKSSSFILGQVSEGIEPHRANFYIKDLAKGKYTIRNAELVDLLIKLGKNTDEVWDSIIRNSGSVQHLDFLNSIQKAVFKTFREISPAYIVSQAIDRQMYVDQGQSLNLMINPKSDPKEINKVYLDGYRGGLKSFYYQIGVNAAQEFSRESACISCEA